MEILFGFLNNVVLFCVCKIPSGQYQENRRRFLTRLSSNVFSIGEVIELLHPCFLLKVVLLSTGKKLNQITSFHLLFTTYK